MDLLEVLHRAQELCACCGIRREDLLLCPCRTVYYCSTSCQLQHWRQHKGTCTKVERSREPKLKHCYYCGKGSYHLRSCQCGLVLYCDAICQGKHWGQHRPLCSTWALPEQQRPERLGRVRRMDAQIQTDPLMFEPAPLFGGLRHYDFDGDDDETRARIAFQQQRDDALVAVLTSSDANHSGMGPSTHGRPTLEAVRRATIPQPPENGFATARSLAASDRSAVGFSGREPTDLSGVDEQDDRVNAPTTMPGDMQDLIAHTSPRRMRRTTLSTDSGGDLMPALGGEGTSVFECSGLMQHVEPEGDIPRPTTAGGDLSVDTDTDGGDKSGKGMTMSSIGQVRPAAGGFLPQQHRKHSIREGTTGTQTCAAPNPLVVPLRTSIVQIADPPPPPVGGGSGALGNTTGGSFYRALGSSSGNLGSFVLGQQQQPLTRKGTVMSNVLHGAAAHLSRNRSGVFGTSSATVSWSRTFESAGGMGGSVLGHALDSPHQRECVLQQEELMMDEEECRSDVVQQRRAELVTASSVLQRLRLLENASRLGSEEDGARIGVVAEYNMWLRATALPTWRRFH